VTSSSSVAGVATSAAAAVAAVQPVAIDVSKDEYSPHFLSEGTMRVLRVSKEEVKRMSVGNHTRYMVAGGEWTLEPLENLPKRIQMWNWLVSCLKKKEEKGPFSHLADHVTKYDVAGLYEAIINSVDIQNPFVFWRNFQDFVNARPEKGEDIFTYFTRLENMERKLCIYDPEEVGTSSIKVVSEVLVR